jgi:RimJ/RimL family protein N-acetyltransferase
MGTGGISVRKATIQDSDLIHAWRNDPVTVEVSNGKRVTLVEHEKWLVRILDDPERHLLICMRNGTPVAVTRLDAKGEGVYEISVNLGPEFRGQKMGAPSILATCDYAETIPCREIRARIKLGNEASIKVFERSGFSQIGNEEEFLILTRTIVPFTGS